MRNAIKSKWTGRIVAAVFAVPPIVVLAWLPFLADKETRAGARLLIGLLLAGFAAWVVIEKVRRSKARRRMVFANTCGTCGYDLLTAQRREGSPDNPNEWAVCPECGRPQAMVSVGHQTNDRTVAVRSDQGG